MIYGRAPVVILYWMSSDAAVVSDGECSITLGIRSHFGEPYLASTVCDAELGGTPVRVAVARVSEPVVFRSPRAPFPRLVHENRETGDARTSPLFSTMKTCAQLE